jgi:MYXO-CTERM domain-containing protein
MASTAGLTERIVALLVVVAVVTAGSGSAVVASENQSEPVDLRPRVDADDVLLRVDFQSDGSADWQVEYRIRLDDANTTEAFEELQRDVESNESAYVSRFASRIRDTVSTAENRTGREMAAENFSVRTERRQLPQEYGVITYSFEWYAFARANETTLQAGDALAGLFLDAETTLLVAWPDGYAPTTVAPAPDETRPRTVVWSGPTDFSSGEPTLVLTTATVTTTARATSERATTAVEEPAKDDGNGGPPTLLVVSLLLALAVAGGAFVARRRRRDDDWPTADDPELLSNEECVRQLLEANDGRVKQQDVVEDLGWTEAKTSRVVNEMHEAGELKVFRLGRENVLSLPEYDT